MRIFSLKNKMYSPLYGSCFEEQESNTELTCDEGTSMMM